MKTQPRNSTVSHRSNLNVVRIATLLALVALIGIPLFSSSLASSSGRATKSGTSTAAPVKDSGSARSQIFNPGIGQTGNFNLLLPQAPPPPPAIATYESTCTTLDSEFNLGQQVCATATSTGGVAARRRITWSDPDGNIRQSTPISSDPQSDNFTIPGTPTSTLSNGDVANNIGKWRVALVGRSQVAFATFVVKDPNNATADLSVTKAAPSNSQSVAAGANGSFDIFVANSGPDDAATVTVVDHVPTNTTFVSLLQTSGQANATFTCTAVPDGLGNVTCSINTFAAGAFATFQFIYTVNVGTPSGTSIINTVSIQSATTNEGNSADNSAAASATVSGGTSTDTCSVGCPDDISIPANTVDGNNQPGAIIHFSPPSGNTECGVIVVDHCNDCFFPQGTTQVTATGAGDSCTFTVTVTPSGSAPTISCPAHKTANADNSCEANVVVGTPTVSGNNVTFHGVRSDGKPMYNCDCFPNSPNQADDACDVNGACTRRADAPFSAGDTTITWIAYSHDIPGPFATPEEEEAHRTGGSSCTQVITVNDVTPPVIAATNSSAPADASCQAPIPDYSSTASDNCACSNTDTTEDCQGHPHFTYSQTPAAGTMVGIGPHTVHIEVNDSSSNNNGAGNTTTKDVIFTVVDQTPPVITCPGNMTANTAPGTCSATVNPGTATATDNCDSTPTITGTRSDSQALNAPYPKGTTTITWRATDDAGNYSECTQTITVQDHENPVIVCPANITRGTDAPSCSATVNPGQPTVTDNCGSTTVTSTRSDGQPMNAPYPKGTTTITWTATDSSGNHSSCTQTITVVDDDAPTITMTAQQSMWPPNHKYETFTTANLVASVQDNCNTIAVSSVVITKVTSDEIENGNGDGNTTNDIVIASNCKSVQLRSEREGNGNGRVYTIFFSVTDAAGNKGTGTTKVVVPHNPGETAVDSGPHYTVTSNCP